MTRRAPSSSSFTSLWEYDVFINFRGEDTRHGFTGNLYNALRQRGIRTFFDDEELRSGEQISPSLLKAIQGSRIAILVFSQNYASSTFCLIELVQILEHLHGQGRLVLPVFYDVDPSEVRKQSGNYAQALAKHAEKSKNDEEKVQKWKLALHQAANLKGCHFKHGDEYEYKFIGKIVEEVSNKIDRKFLYIAEYPVGLEARVLEVKSLIGIGFDDRVNMIGIYGIGGSGKSTIARGLYNLIADQFECVCFLDDIREKSLKLGLVSLQETLLFEFVKKDIKLGNVNQGVSILKSSLHEKKVLLILDDIDNIKQLRALAGAPNWFAPGSTIIITTRDQHLLNIHSVDKKYEVQQLNHTEALELLRWNAFQSNEVDPNYMDILNSVAYYAQGLPLALEVIGSNLFGKSLNEWKSAFDTYKRIPIKEVQQVLKVSFDCLEEDQQKIFLDIASFYRGNNREYVMDMVQFTWDFHPEHGIRVLIDKSLIKIIHGCITMHDLIHDMGIEIVRQESKEPGKRSRLWSIEDIIHVLEENTGSDKIKAIIQNPSSEVMEVNWDGKAFKKMKNLRILIIEKARFSKGPKYLPNCLKVIKWQGYPFVSLPSDFHPRKLVTLQLRHSCLRSLEPIKKLHEVGHKRFLVPGASIPKWCDHYNSGLSIAFWFRNNVPRICLYFVVTSQAEPYFDLYLSVNGKYRRKINPLAELEGWNPLLDHILCVNEGSIFRSPELNKVLLQSERNSIEISMYLNGFRSVKEIGMNIMNQGNKRKKLDALNWDPSFGVSISYEEEKLEGGIHALRSINTEFDSYWKQHVKDEFTKSNANPNRDVVSSPAESIKLSEVPQVGKGKAGGSVVVSGSDDRSILLNEDKMLQRQPELLFHTATGIDLQQQQNLTSISQEIQESSISQPISKSFENIRIAKRNRDNTDEGKDSNMLEDLVKSEYQMAHQKGQLFSDNQSAKRAKSQEE